MGQAYARIPVVVAWSAQRTPGASAGVRQRRGRMSQHSGYGSGFAPHDTPPFLFRCISEPPLHPDDGEQAPLVDGVRAHLQLVPVDLGDVPPIVRVPDGEERRDGRPTEHRPVVHPQIEGVVRRIPAADQRPEISQAWEKRYPPTRVATQRLSQARLIHSPSRARYRLRNQEPLASP